MKHCLELEDNFFLFVLFNLRDRSIHWGRYHDWNWQVHSLISLVSQRYLNIPTFARTANFPRRAEFSRPSCYI